jgi:catechol 2,3-dioxygenase-like lactoylglutathione lyase family enzyme
VNNFDGVLSERIEKEGVQWARVTVAGAMINITDRASESSPLAVYTGLDHFGVHTSNFDETINALRANGVDFFIEPHSPAPGVQIAFVSGPDNVKIEILQVNKD